MHPAVTHEEPKTSGVKLRMMKGKQCFSAAAQRPQNVCKNQNVTLIFRFNLRGSGMATPRRREFQNLSLKDIFKKLYKNNPATIDWCRSNGLLAAGCLCKKCDVECTEGTLALSPDGSTWRCPSCRRRYVGTDIKISSFFSGTVHRPSFLLSFGRGVD